MVMDNGEIVETAPAPASVPTPETVPTVAAPAAPAKPEPDVKGAIMEIVNQLEGRYPGITDAVSYYFGGQEDGEE